MVHNYKVTMAFENIAWSIAFALVSIAITVTNAFTIFIFTRRQFKRKLSHYLPINLAVTDLLVGAVALPQYVGLWNRRERLLFHCYQFFDITAGVASVSSIAFISLERLYAIGWPCKHRLLNRKHYFIGIAFTWMYAIVFMVLLNFLYGRIIRMIRVHVMIWGISLPLLITFIACVLICVMKRRSERNVQRRPNIQQNNKLVQTLLTVIVVFWLTWLPFTIYMISWSSCRVRGRCWFFPPSAEKFLKFLHYSNSLANPVIYALRLQGFRSTVKETLCKRRRPALVVRRASPAISRIPERQELQKLEIKEATAEL